jgi:hypothetical protein
MTDLEKPVGKDKNAKKSKKLRKNSRKAAISQRKFKGIKNVTLRNHGLSSAKEASC